MIKTAEILIDHPSFQIRKIEGNLLNAHHKEGEMSLKVFMELISYVKIYAKENGQLYVVNSQDLRFSFSNEAWKYIRKESGGFTFITAQALVAKELHFRILAKFHAKVTKSRTTFKVVATLEEGTDWLRKRMVDNDNLAN